MSNNKRFTYLLTYLHHGYCVIIIIIIVIIFVY